MCITKMSQSASVSRGSGLCLVCGVVPSLIVLTWRYVANQVVSPVNKDLFNHDRVLSFFRTQLLIINLSTLASSAPESHV